jgi:hypothetical protein
MDIDGRKVEKTPDYKRTQWYTDDGRSMDWALCKMRKGTQRPHKDLHRRVKEGRKRRIRGHNKSAINTKKDKRPLINIQRGTRSHHRCNTEATENGGQRSDIY